METFESLMTGFQVAIDPVNLLAVTVGVLIGTFVGSLPGIGSTTAIALLMPFTFTLDPATAIIMLAGIYYGGMYGGRIPAILLRIPGDSSSVITTFDGYPLTQQGRGGAALGITAIGSFLGGTVAILGLTLFAPVLARYAVRIGPPDMFALALLGVVLIITLTGTSVLKGLLVAGLGFLVAAIGIDQISGTTRLTFGSLNLTAGINIVPLAVGLFGVGEILHKMEATQESNSVSKFTRLLPTLADWAQSRAAILRASIIGFLIGVIPGGGGTVSSVIAYGAEKKFSKQPDKFGKGAIDGLAATETADNASSNSAFIPLLTLGLPPNAVLALLFGALLIHDVNPGPQMINERPDIFWGVIASMYIGNILLLLLNLPLIGLFVQVLKIRPAILYPLILVLSFVGVYSVDNSYFDVWLTIIFGLLGYFLRKWGYELAPLILAFILGPIMESYFRRATMIFEGDLTGFIERPIPVVIFCIIAAVISYSVISARRKKRRHSV